MPRRPARVTQARMLTKIEAADYCGLSVARFTSECPVSPTLFGQGVNRVVRWDLHRLDDWLDGFASSATGDDWLSRADIPDGNKRARAQ